MAKFKSKGVLVKIGNVSYVAATAIAQLGDGTLDLGAREAALDVTDHSNSTGTVDLMDNGFKTPISYSGEIFWDADDTGHELARASLESGASLFCRIIIPNTGTAQWDAMIRVKSFTAPLPVKGALKGSISFEGMGSNTFTQ